MTGEDRQEYIQLRALLVRLITVMKSREQELLDNPEKKYLQGSIKLADNVNLERLDESYSREDGKISDKVGPLMGLYRGLAEIGSYVVSDDEEIVDLIARLDSASRKAYLRARDNEDGPSLR